MDIIGSIYALHIIPFHTSHCNITNISVQLDLGVSTTDQVKWQLLETSVLSVQDINFQMESDFLNWVISFFHDTIMGTINAYIPQIEDTLHKIVEDFDAEMRTANSTTFMVNLLNNTLYPLNMSTTEAPQLDSTQGLLELHFDGLFFDSPAQTTHVTPNSQFAPRYASSHSEQFFVHESMLNSLFFALDQDIMPIKI
jgi:hypothetical protein